MVVVVLEVVVVRLVVLSYGQLHSIFLILLSNISEQIKNSKSDERCYEQYVHRSVTSVFRLT